MKDRHLRVRPSCCKRGFYLFKPKGIAAWHIKFMPPRWSFWRAKLGNGIVYRSTGTSEIAPAKDIAERIINSFWKTEDDHADRENVTVQTELATIGQVLAVYIARAQERPRTLLSNANALRRMIETVHGTDADSRSTSVLTANLIREFERKSEANTTSIASYVTQARSVFSPRKMKFYEEFRLPDLTGFRAEKVARPEVVDLEPPDLNALRAMDAASVRLAQDDPGAYVAHLLFSRAGLRNIEIWNARTWWIATDRIGIISRPAEGFKPKGRSGWVRMGLDVVNEILKFQHLCTDDYLVPGKDKTERYRAIYRRHSAWVKKWIPDETKTSYELRRYFGSRLLDLGWSIFEVRDALRHRDIQTTQRWYAYRLQDRDLPVIGMKNLVPEDNVVKMA